MHRTSRAERLTTSVCDSTTTPQPFLYPERRLQPVAGRRHAPWAEIVRLPTRLYICTSCFFVHFSPSALHVSQTLFFFLEFYFCETERVFMTVRSVGRRVVHYQTRVLISGYDEFISTSATSVYIKINMIM